MRDCIVLGGEKKKSTAETHSGTAEEFPQSCHKDGQSKAKRGDRREQQQGTAGTTSPRLREGGCRGKTPNKANYLTKKIEKII